MFNGKSLTTCEVDFEYCKIIVGYVLGYIWNLINYEIKFIPRTRTHTY